MIHPIFYSSLCTIIIFWTVLLFWLRKSDEKLKNLYIEYKHALLTGNEQYAKEAGRRYYSAISFGKLYARDEQFIESDINEAFSFVTE